MIRAAARFVPSIRQTQYLRSLYTTKTILPASEQSDSRPILCREAVDCPGLYSILGGKIDNIYDIRHYLDAIFEGTEQSHAN
jgi:hypothetical protein